MRVDPITTAFRACEVAIIGEIKLAESLADPGEAIDALSRSGIRTVSLASVEEAIERVAVESPPSVVVLAASLETPLAAATSSILGAPTLRGAAVIVEVDSPNPLPTVRAFRSGASDVLTRPYSPEEMIARIQTQLGRQRHRRRLEATIRDLEGETRLLRDQLHGAQKNLEAETFGNERMSFAILKALEGANRYKDNDRGNHVRRVAACASLLAQLHGCPPGYVERLRRGAPLHDIGKIAVPDRVLAQTGPYTREERTIMEQHTLCGVELLDEAVDPMIFNIVRFHHEHWDGSGYPDSLRDAAIPLEARIVAVADRYDALLSARPSRRALTRDEAMRVLEESAGSHLDPDLVELVLLHRDTWEQTWLKADRGVERA